MNTLNLSALLTSAGVDGYLVTAQDVSDKGKHPEDHPYRVMGCVLNGDGEINDDFPPVVHYCATFMEAQTHFAQMVILAVSTYDEEFITEVTL